MVKTGKKALGVLLAVLMVVTMAMPALTAAAADAQIVITNEDGVEVTERLEVREFESVELGYTTSGDVPEGAYVTWSSSQPLLAGVDENGEVHGYDFSKEAIVQQWLDENVRVLPLIGDSLADSILQTIEDNGIDLSDPADIELFIELVGAMGGSLGESLANSLRETLDNMNIVIHRHAARGRRLGACDGYGRGCRDAEHAGFCEHLPDRGAYYEQELCADDRGGRRDGAAVRHVHARASRAGRQVDDGRHDF